MLVRVPALIPIYLHGMKGGHHQHGQDASVRSGSILKQSPDEINPTKLTCVLFSFQLFP
jgi:hypothetical protein